MLIGFQENYEKLKAAQLFQTRYISGISRFKNGPSAALR
jgi:hypothetical protein